MNRRETIERIAYLIADVVGAVDDHAGWARQLNRDGWTFDTSAPLGNWIRHEGVELNERELQQAVEMAEAIAAGTLV